MAGVKKSTKLYVRQIYAGIYCAVTAVTRGQLSIKIVNTLSMNFGVLDFYYEIGTQIEWHFSNGVRARWTAQP